MWIDDYTKDMTDLHINMLETIKQQRANLDAAMAVIQTQKTIIAKQQELIDLSKARIALLENTVGFVGGLVD